MLMLLAAVGCANDNTSDVSDTTTLISKDTGVVMADATDMQDSLDKMNGTAALNNGRNADSIFMVEAATGGMLEVEMGKVAMTNASDESVKQFGKMMVEDHGMANEKLKALASKKSISLPKTLDEKGVAHINDMKKMKGKNFDKAYVSMMVNDHNNDIAKFENQSNNGTDADIKAFATSTLPTLKKHKEKITEINEKMK